MGQAATTPGSFGADSELINGNLTNTPQSYQYAPQGWGPQTVGVPNITPAFPPYIGGATPTSSAPGASSVGGYGTADNNAMVTQIANAHPFNWKVSPVLWAVGGLIIALVALKTVHWNDVIAGSETLDFGPGHERAEAGA